MDGDKKSIVFLYCPLFEFTSYTKFGFFVHCLKQHPDYQNKTLLAAIPEEAVGCVPSADALLAYCHSSKLENYLNIMDSGSFGRENHFSFFNRARIMLEKNFTIEEEIVFHEQFIKLNNKELQTEFSSVERAPWSSYRLYFSKYKELLLKHDYWLKPFHEDYLSIKSEMGERKIFSQDKKNYIIITRNFEKKQPESNTDKIVPQLEPLMKFLIDNQINLINIGFPPNHYNFQSENYKELNESFTQSELMSIFYLSDGILLNGKVGGFMPLSMTLNNVFLLTEEWSIKILGEEYRIESWRNETKKVKTFNLLPSLLSGKFDVVLDLMKKSPSPSLANNEKFAKKQNIYYIKDSL